MDADDVIALGVGVSLVVLLGLIVYRAHRYGSPGVALLIAYPIVLVLALLVVAEEAL
jgi:hypothetical protein